MKATSKESIQIANIKSQPSLRDQIIKFVRARYTALEVREGIALIPNISVKKLDKSIKTYMHYTSDSFWHKWLLSNISDIENILPSPTSRYWLIRLKGLELINKVKNNCESCETIKSKPAPILEASRKHQPNVYVQTSFL
jgi:hypothetical protein